MVGGGAEQNSVWREIPLWAAVDSKHKSGTVLWQTPQMFLLEWEVERNNLAVFPRP